ncbi:MAG: hypothetical protein ACM3U2_03250 [Deltaproteobacteria bacterium]
MAKKKPVRRKKPPAVRKRAKTNPRKGARAAVRRKAPRAAAPSANSAPSLGRPKVTGEEDLDMLFREDFHARQIFKFLNVATVKQLEQFSAGEILRRLSRPIKETVERIRRSLAERNRCLAGDEEFAVEHKQHVTEITGGR